ncbi:hypothetical protein LYSHEL_25610 [Lysobacter helvus]|uniref:Uncharacterized protein n=2 Tax=Lysobacteraceae TaxID=32033 RepID=A0ABM7Q7Z3_9GAMM|nr:MULTISPECIES: hypothetical protein [Lysobacter]BCT93537.1 hypothetical protein LYSCAS_25610 [Lysobacter caseinilyticus]BCT96690.1 hypothetical protein LYSHEL_25610 [Lysobacter helvus]
MARPSPAALDVMEHIAEAMDMLTVLLASMDHMDEHAVAEEIARARAELLKARATGAEVVLELLNLSEQRELMQGEIDQFRDRTH